MTAMLERETELIIQTLVSRTIRTAETIALRDAVAADIPRGVKTYLRAEVVRWIEKDFAAAPSLRHVDRGASGVEKLTKHFLRTLAENYMFSRGDFLTILDNAVHFLENYLCRPQWTLASFVYQDARAVTPVEIIEKLDFFSDYGYFPLLLERAMLHRPDESIELEEFKTLLAKIDDQVVRQHSPRELAVLTKPIYDFLLLTDTADTNRIPVKPILVFLDDKKMRIMREYVERICGIRRTHEIHRTDLAALIEDLYRGEAPSEPPALGVQDRPDEIALPPDSSPQIDDQPSLFGRNEEALPGTHPDPTDRNRKNIPLSLTYAGLRGELPPSGTSHDNLPDLNGLIPGELRDRLIKSVFMNDVEYYGTIIAALGSFTTWAEASTYIDQLCEINDLDPSNLEMKEFSAAVKHRYSEGGKE